MHYHCEIWFKELPKSGKSIDRNAVQSLVEDVLRPFDEQDANNKGNATFYDWYELGGRYTGRHDNYKPWNDPVNKEICNLCNGTGSRPDMKAEEMKWVRGCNACSGTGIKTKYSFAIHPQDIMPLAEVRDNMSCYTLIIASNIDEPEVLHFETWDGKTFNKNEEFDGNNVKAFLKSKGITDGYLVTVDYHD